MREELENDGADKMSKPYKFEALCSAYNSKKNPQQWGVLMFYLHSSKQSGIVSHEMTHATTYWWKHLAPKNHKNIYKDGIADEKFAWIQGNLVSQYWRTWYEINKPKK